MAIPIRRVIRSAVTGNLDGVSAGEVVAGETVRTAVAKEGSIQALFEYTIATGSLTLAPEWQVSDDGVTFYDLREGAGTVPQAIAATGSEVLACPEAAETWLFCRPAIIVAGNNASASDTYSMTVRYVRRQTFAN